jgi:hypothetical protein
MITLTPLTPGSSALVATSGDLEVGIIVDRCGSYDVYVGDEITDYDSLEAAVDSLSQGERKS